MSIKGGIRREDEKGGEEFLTAPHFAHSQNLHSTQPQKKHNCTQTQS